MKTILCRWFNWHVKWSRREGSYSEKSVNGGETVYSSELRQCAYCGLTIVRSHTSETSELKYETNNQEEAERVFHRAQLLGFEGGQA